MAEEKICKKCGKTKATHEFHEDGYRQKDGSRGLRGQCKKCRIALNREYNKRNLEKRRKSSRKYERRRGGKNAENPSEAMSAKLMTSSYSAKRLGFRPCSATVNELLMAFTGKCHACGITEGDCKRALCMDHCHISGRFRGWLCGRCNVAAGLLRESAENALNLAAYIERTKVSVLWQK